jgi:predicted 3-demethylubiquinone-9 3-methyltransferase (glyoxalase superfamily)
MPTESEIEIRPVFEAEDFGAEFTPELRAQEERLRAKADRLAPARQADRANRRESSMPTLQRITPCLWFDRQAEEAAKLYTSMFRNSRIGAISRYGEAGREIHGMPAGTVLTVAFELDGHSFTALNGGPQFTFNEAISLQVNCDSQDEVDYYWNGLSAGGDPRFQQCGWLKDRFGLSWQVVPTVLPRLMTDPDPKKSERVMTALLGMKKLDIAVLEKAHAG